ncbi:MAG: hypothetical protein JXD19_12605 [Deltaproteobacteria bacterium]|nr:hypothetical protein [Deltaproteobacteria bacterium]
MTTNDTRRKVFRKAQDIMDYYEMSRPAFEHYVKLGMPVRIINGAYHGHSDNIDEWFRKMTAYSMKELQEETNEKGK